MSAVFRLFSKSCLRLRIFLCYAREDRNLAREIAQTLTNDGHDVFIDANSLKVATDFNEEIRRAIGRADRFVFLASRHSLAADAYPQTELGFAQKRWPSPKGTVWPVLIDPSLDPAELPLYLRSVQVHTPKGNIVADLAAEIDASRTVRTSCLSKVAATIVLLSVAIFALMRDGHTNFTLLPPQQLVLMPQKKPTDAAWMASPATLTVIPVSYSNDGRRDVRVIGETVSMELGGKAVSFKAFNVVEIRQHCPDWLCYKAGVSPSTLSAEGTLARETMFVPAPGQTLAWKELIVALCTSAADTLTVTLAAETRSGGFLGTRSETRETACRIDLMAVREHLQNIGCDKSDVQLPTRLVRNCLN